MQTKAILNLLGAVLLGIVVFFIGGTILKWKAGSEMNEQRAAKIETTSDMINDSVTEQKTAAEIDGGVIGAKNVYGENKNAEYKANPSSRSWADANRPERLRQLAKERRIARQRLGRDIEQRDNTLEAAPAK